MSEVLIRMKMPKCCEECQFFTWKRGVGQHCAVDDRITFNTTLDGFDVGYERNGECPLIPVSPHGRLIDADALCEGRVSNDNVVICAKAAPTIIPSSEEE